MGWLSGKEGLLLRLLIKVSIEIGNQINCSSEQPEGTSTTVEPNLDIPGWSIVTKKNSNGEVVEVIHMPNDRVPAYLSQGSKSNPISVDDSDSSASSPIPVDDEEGSASNPIPVEESASDIEKEEEAKKPKNPSSNDDNGKGEGSNPSSGPYSAPSGGPSSAPSGGSSSAPTGSSEGGSTNRTQEILGILLGLLGGFLENIPDVLNNLYLCSIMNNIHISFNWQSSFRFGGGYFIWTCLCRSFMAFFICIYVLQGIFIDLIFGNIICRILYGAGFFINCVYTILKYNIELKPLLVMDSKPFLLTSSDGNGNGNGNNDDETDQEEDCYGTSEIMDDIDDVDKARNGNKNALKCLEEKYPQYFNTSKPIENSLNELEDNLVRDYHTEDWYEKQEIERLERKEEFERNQEGGGSGPSNRGTGSNGGNGTGNGNGGTPTSGSNYTDSSYESENDSGNENNNGGSNFSKLDVLLLVLIYILKGLSEVLDLLFNNFL